MSTILSRRLFAPLREFTRSIPSPEKDMTRVDVEAVSGMQTAEPVRVDATPRPPKAKRLMNKLKKDVRLTVSSD